MKKGKCVTEGDISEALKKHFKGFEKCVGCCKENLDCKDCGDKGKKKGNKGIDLVIHHQKNKKLVIEAKGLVGDSKKESIKSVTFGVKHVIGEIIYDMGRLPENAEYYLALPGYSKEKAKWATKKENHAARKWKEEWGKIEKVLKRKGIGIKVIWVYNDGEIKKG